MADTSTIARPYAQALFDIAKRDDALANWAQTLGALAQVVIDEDASAFLTRPDIDEEARVEFVSELSNQLGAANLWRLGATHWHFSVQRRPICGSLKGTFVGEFHGVRR